MNKFMAILSFVTISCSAYAAEVNQNLLRRMVDKNTILFDLNDQKLDQSELFALQNIVSHSKSFLKISRLDDYDNVFLTCDKTSLFIAVGGAISGDCIVYELKTDGKLSFRLLKLNGLKIGYGLMVHLLTTGNRMRISGVNSLEDISGYFYKLSSSLMGILGGEVVWGFRSLNNRTIIYSYLDTDSELGIATGLEILALTGFRLTAKTGRTVTVQLPLEN